MDDGKPCYISVAHTGVLVKQSRLGLFGPKLFREDPYKSAMTAKALAYLFPVRRVPPEISNPILMAFTNAVLQCDTTGQVAIVLNEGIHRAEELAGTHISEIVPPDWTMQDFLAGP